MMSWAVAFQMNGFGSRFQCSAQVVIASARSATLVNRPRRRRPSVSSFNQRSIRFSRRTRRRGEVQVPAPPVFVGQPVGDFRRGVRGQVVQHYVHGQAAGTAASICL